MDTPSSKGNLSHHVSLLPVTPQTQLNSPASGDKELLLWQRIAASSNGAFITALTMTPFDVIKIRLQAQAKPFTKGQCFIYCNGLMDHICACLDSNANSKSVTRQEIPSSATVHWYSKPSNFLNSRDAFIKIVKNEGVFALWNGLSPTLIMALPQTVLYFTLNDWLKTRIGYMDAAFASHSSHSSAETSAMRPSRVWSVTKEDLIPPAVGGVSRLFVLTLISPVELIRTKLQSTSESVKMSELLAILWRSAKQGDVRPLFTGLTATMLRDIPFSAIFWFLFDFMKRRWSVPVPSLPPATSSVTSSNPSILSTLWLDPNFRRNFLFGAVSGTIAGVLTLPFDVIKTHRQMELGEAVFKNRTVERSTWRSIQTLYHQKGFRALFSGLIPRVFKVAPACSLMIGTFEGFKIYFCRRNSL